MGSNPTSGAIWRSLYFGTETSFISLTSLVGLWYYTGRNILGGREMKTWSDKYERMSRWSLSVRKDEDVVLRYEELRDGRKCFTVESFLGSGCTSAVLQATTLEAAKVEAESWYASILLQRISQLEDTIEEYREAVGALGSAAVCSASVSA